VIYTYAYVNSNPVSYSVDGYYVRSMWQNMGSPIGLRQIEIRCYDAQYSSSYGQDVPAADCFFVGSVWVNFQQI
jgi:hypothetical protein